MNQPPEFATPVAAAEIQTVRDKPEQGLLMGAAALAMLLAVQLYLVFYKSFNWDEFLHFSQVYLARNGTLAAPFQVLHSRILFWVPDTAESLVEQLRLARFFMWGCTLVTLAAIYGLAGQFTTRVNALYAAIAYLTAGYVFTQSFSIRADPMAAAALMSALYLFASGRLTAARAVAAGALIGLAGMITLKSVFYAPCFAGIAWWRYRQAGGRPGILWHIAAMTFAALLVFALIYTLHSSGLADVPERFNKPGKMLENGSRWFLSDDKSPVIFLIKQALFGVVFTILLLASPIAWRMLKEPSFKIALLGLVVPLAVVLVYRNTYPYFYVFLLAPVAVSIAPAIGLVRARYGNTLVLLLLAICPLFFTLTEPRDVFARQQAMLEYIRGEYPAPVGYLERSGAIADYPPALTHLTTGNGIRGYYQRGEPIIADKIKRGELAFVLGTAPPISAAIAGKPIERTFLPEDVALLSDNFVQQWGPLYRAAKAIPVGNNPHRFEVPSAGRYTLDGERLVIDGREVTRGETIELDAGQHSASGPRASRMILWRGERLPSPPPMEWDGPFYTRF
ncbi:MAG: hypothetical protein ACO25F_02200 [Erythrobacter sp.]